MGNEEIELKLQLAPEDIATVLTHPVFAAHEPVTRTMSATYFDTDDHALHDAGLSLRIRTSAGRRIQTIKTESRAAASLFARGEWEREVHDDVPDLGDAPALLVDALDDGTRPLAPIFTVAVDRTIAVYATGRDRIELVADEGCVRSGGRESPIAELELELLDGSTDAIFDLARRLAGLVPVRLGVRTKSERGYALLAGKPASSFKAERIPLARDGDSATAFEAIAGSCIRQFRLNEDRLLDTGAPAPLHQARVGLRRLRNALSIFAPMLEGAELDRFQSQLREIAGALGGVRDIDVMIDRIDHAPTLAQLNVARDRRLAAVVELLDSDAVRTLMLDLVGWISIGAWRDRAETAELRTAPVLLTAAQLLDRLRRRVKRRGGHLADLDAHDRHRVRIAAKKLRYAAEFFADLYRGKKAARRQKAFFGAIGDLQTMLGHLNDLAGGRALLDDLEIADADTILTDGRKANRKRLLADAGRAHAELIGVKRFWR